MWAITRVKVWRLPFSIEVQQLADWKYRMFRSAFSFLLGEMFEYYLEVTGTLTKKVNIYLHLDEEHLRTAACISPRPCCREGGNPQIRTRVTGQNMQLCTVTDYPVRPVETGGYLHSLGQASLLAFSSQGGLTAWHSIASNNISFC
jgi:hypothetical protein